VQIGRFFTLALAAVAALTVVSSSANVRAESTSSDARYVIIAQTFFYDQFRDNPSNATDAGLHEYDDRLDDLSAAHFAAQLGRDRIVLAKLDSIDPASLSAEVRIDRQMLIWNIQDDLLQTGEEANWRHKPDLYTQVASDAIYQLMARNYVSPATRLRYVIARERDFPRLFAQARQNVTTVDAASAQVARQDTSGAVAFFRHDVPLAFTSVKDSALLAQFRTVNATAANEVERYAAWIQAGPLARASGTFAIGKEAYQRRLLYDDGVTMSVDDYLAIGERALGRTQARFRATAHAIDPNASPLDVYDSLGANHPSASHLLAAAQNDVGDLRAFVHARHILTLPSDADITVVETPTFQRSQIFAAFSGPGPLEKVATQSYYYVTPPDASAPAAVREESLGALNDYWRPILGAHEVMPGHFLNYAVDKHLDLSLTRRLLWNPECGEGWAHYDEQMIVDEGWGGGNPRVRLGQLAGALLREGRFVVGVKEHTAGMTVDEATRFLEENAYASESTARREALRGTQDPMYGYYTFGKMMILKLRDDYKKKLGSSYTLQRFHDAFLAHGDPPIPLLRPLLLGSDDDGKVL